MDEPEKWLSQKRLEEMSRGATRAEFTWTLEECCMLTSELLIHRKRLAEQRWDYNTVVSALNHSNDIIEDWKRRCSELEQRLVALGESP